MHFKAATIEALLHSATQRLQGCPAARLDAQLLLCHVLDYERARLYSHGTEPVPAEQVQQFRRLVDARRQGMPIAYLLGQREFWSLPLRVSTATLVPRPETESLVQALLPLIPERGTVVDAGTGSGAIALALASELPTAQILGIDIDAAALAVAADNARRLQLPVTFIRADWLACLGSGQVDVVAANPPYVCSADPHLDADGVRFEPRLALEAGADGLAALRQVIPGASRCLRRDGWLGVEHGYDQGPAVRQLLENNQFDQVRTISDDAGTERVSLGRRR